MFLDLLNGTYVNLDHVVKIHVRRSLRKPLEVKQEPDHYTFVMQDGEPISESVWGGINMAALSARVITASPGYFAMRFWPEEGDEPYLIDRDPIVAWEIGEAGIDAAIGVNERHGGYVAILCPDGRVIVAEDSEHSSEAGWIESEKRKHDRMKDKPVPPSMGVPSPTENTQAPSDG